MSESSKRRRYVFDNREDNHSCSVAQHTSSPLEEVKYTARYFFRDRSRRCHDVQAFYDNGAALSALSFVSMIEEMKARSAAEFTPRTRLIEARVPRHNVVDGLRYGPPRSRIASKMRIGTNS